MVGKIGLVPLLLLLGQGLSWHSDSLLDGDIDLLLAGVPLHALLILISLIALVHWRVRVKRLGVLIQLLGLADSLVRVAHFVEYASATSAASDLDTLSAVVGVGLLLLLLAHLVVVSYSIHFTLTL